MTPTPPRAQTPRGVGGPKFLAPRIRGTNLHMHTKFHPNRSTQPWSAACSHIVKMVPNNDQVHTPQGHMRTEPEHFFFQFFT